MWKSSVVAGLVLLVLAAVVDGQSSACNDACVVAVESSRGVLQRNVSSRSISVNTCQLMVTNMTSAIVACRNTWPGGSCQTLDARLSNVTAYLQTACSILTTCNNTYMTIVQNAAIACQPTAFSKLAINGIASRINICKSVQAAIDCITSTAAPCITSIEANIDFELLYDVYLGLWFDCSLTIRGVPVVNTFTAVCSYPTYAKCYNPILSALGKPTITDSFDYLSLYSGLDSLFSYPDATKYCNMIGSSVNWASVKSCLAAASVNCGEALGEPPSVPLGSLEDIWDDMYQSLSVSLKYLELFEDMCSSGCNNLATRSTRQAACPALLPLANNVLQNAFKTDTTAQCSALSAAINCINSNVSGCRPLREDIYYNILSDSNSVFQVQTAAYLCGVALDAKLPWERCRNKEAASYAAQIEVNCISPGLMMKNSAASGAGSVDYIMLSLRNMYQCSNWNCWQNEAVYISKLYPFVAVMQAYYNSTVAPTLGGILVNRLKGANCDIRGYIQCLQPLLTAVGSSFYPAQWASLSALLSGSAADVQPWCSNLTQVDWDSMISCAEGRWSSTCSTPVIDIPATNVTLSMSRSLNKFYLTDLRALKTWVSSICMPNCSGVTFAISAQQIIQCVYYGGTQNRVLEQSKLALLAGFLGQPTAAYCRNLSQAAECLQAISPGCSYLDSVRNQMISSAQYSIAMSMCFPSSVVGTTVSGGNVNGDTSTRSAGSDGGDSTKSGNNNGQSGNGGNYRVSRLPLGGVIVAFVLSSLVARTCSLRHS